MHIARQRLRDQPQMISSGPGLPSTMNNQKTSLSDLPEELIEHIAALLPPKSYSLLDFSATCKRQRRISQKLILAHFFTHRTFLLTNQASLETLLSISQHGIFAKSLESICLSFSTLREASETVRDDLTSCHDHPCDHVKEITAPLRNIDRQLIRVHQRLLKEERRFRHKAVDVRLLHVIVSNFKAIGHFPAIIAGGRDFLSEEYQQSAWGYNGLSRMLGLPSVSTRTHLNKTRLGAMSCGRSQAHRALRCKVDAIAPCIAWRMLRECTG